MNTDLKRALQDHYAPQSICYGCGPNNPDGLQIKSFVQSDHVIAHFTPQPHHQAFPGVLNGGIIASVLDCHCNWAACWYLMQHLKLSTPPCTVTAEMNISLKKPTPADQELTLTATLERITNSSAVITASLTIQQKIYDTFSGRFVLVPADHPAYHRW